MRSPTSEEDRGLSTRSLARHLQPCARTSFGRPGRSAKEGIDGEEEDREEEDREEEDPPRREIAKRDQVSRDFLTFLRLLARKKTPRLI